MKGRKRKVEEVAEKEMGLEIIHKGSNLSYLPAVGTLSGHLTSLGLSFLICKIRNVVRVKLNEIMIQIYGSRFSSNGSVVGVWWESWLSLSKLWVRGMNLRQI